MDNGASSYRRFLDGDDNGLTEIIRDYKDGLTLYLNSFVNDIYVAEELMEDTFFKLITKKPGFSEKYSFKTWLYTIGRNVAIDFLRKNSKKSEASVEDVENLLREEYNLEELYIKKEQGIELHRAMKKINPEYAQVLWLVYFEGFTSAEITLIMKKNSKQMKNLIYRAKEALKKQLEKEGFVYEEL